MQISCQLHPAVLMRYLRLMTAIRLATRASWNCWCILFVARGHTRSWLTSLHNDIRWLVASSPLFSEINAATPAEWLQLAKISPFKTAAAIKKACGTSAVINLALALQDKASGFVENLAPSPDAVQTIYTCDQCSYSCNSVHAMTCHGIVAHAQTSTVSRCIDTAWCSICGLLFDSPVGVRNHVWHSDICRLNLLWRGPFLQGDSHLEALAVRAAVIKKNNKAGVGKEKNVHLCVRTFGPHQPILDGSGEIVLPSRRGHPLGNNKALHLPSNLTEVDNYVEVGCPAARYELCSPSCGLCGGR